MLWNRIRGLWTAYHGILAVVLTVLYWILLMAISPVLKHDALEHFQRFLLYNVAAIFGLIVAAIRGRSAAPMLLAGGFVNYHKLSLKQTVYIGVMVLLAMVVAMDPDSQPRSTQFLVLLAFLVALYFTFLVCHFFVPKRLADHLFSEEHEQRTLLVGPVDKARMISKWVLETAAFGFGLRGSQGADESEEGRVLHVTRISDVAMLQRIIKHEGIRQILLLELPLDQEGLNLIVDAANKSGVRLLVLNNLPEIFRHDISFFNLHGKDFISLRDEPLEDPTNRIIKRAVDLLMSLPVVLFVLPPLCLV
ncbi:MAG TPA: hypothetical protein VIT23_03095, partial [Terrimicrobiaceae bacterium]